MMIFSRRQGLRIDSVMSQANQIFSPNLVRF